MLSKSWYSFGQERKTKQVISQTSMPTHHTWTWKSLRRIDQLPWKWSQAEDAALFPLQFWLLSLMCVYSLKHTHTHRDTNWVKPSSLLPDKQFSLIEIIKSLLLIVRGTTIGRPFKAKIHPFRWLCFALLKFCLQSTGPKVSSAKRLLSLEISILALLCLPFFFKIYFRGCHTSEISFNGQNHFVFRSGF